MATLALKLYYLRTRVRKATQRQVAADLGIRQAQISQLERSRARPTIDLLRLFCRYFDVTADYLLDDEVGVAPLPTDRRATRHARVTVGMWIEAPAGAVVPVAGGKLLCPLLPGERFFGEEAKRLREEVDPDRVDEALAEAGERRAREEADLEGQLALEIEAHNERRGRRRST